MDVELKEILLKAKKQVFSNLTGESLSRLKGDGMDLRDIKQYEWGDDVRRINWKASAKSSQLLVNTYDEYKQLDVTLVFLASSTLNFGSKRLKQDVACEVFAYLLYSAYKNKDRCESLVFKNKSIDDFPPIKEQPAIDGLVENIYNLDTFESSVDFEFVTSEINKRYKKGKILVFVGDFLTLPDFSLLSKKHQTYAVVIRDKLEESLEFDKEITLKDTLTNHSDEFFITNSIQKNYSSLINSHDKKLQQEFTKNNISYQKIKTDDDVYLKLVELFR